MAKNVSVNGFPLYSPSGTGKATSISTASRVGAVPNMVPKSVPSETPLFKSPVGGKPVVGSHGMKIPTGAVIKNQKTPDRTTNGTYTVKAPNGKPKV